MTNAKKPKTCICYYPSNFKSNKAGITELLRNKTHLCLGTPFIHFPTTSYSIKIPKTLSQPQISIRVTKW